MKSTENIFELWTPRETAKSLRVTVGALANWRRLGGGPPFCEAGSDDLVRYDPRRVREWIEEQTSEGRQEPVASARGRAS